MPINKKGKNNLLFMVQNNPKLTSRELQHEVKSHFYKTVSYSTIRRIINKSGYMSCVARKKTYISKINLEKWVQFANDNISKPPEFWKSIIFSYESKIYIFGIGGKKWRKSGKALKKQNLLPLFKHGEG